jgi:hypothetical protein
LSFLYISTGNSSAISSSIVSISSIGIIFTCRHPANSIF